MPRRANTDKQATPARATRVAGNARAPKKAKPAKSIEETLWAAANKLRGGGVEPTQYKHVVLGLLFLKFCFDKFDRQRSVLSLYEDADTYVDMPVAYTKDNVFYLPEWIDETGFTCSSRWDYLITNKEANPERLALDVDAALKKIEEHNKSLEGALPVNFYSTLSLEPSKLSSLMDEINKISTDGDEGLDIIGRVYEFFLLKFAIQEGGSKQEFYTPKCVVSLISEMIEPFSGKIYDPCCGTGGMFVQSVRFIDAHAGNRLEASIYGQEYTDTTFRLAKMNLAIRGISADLGKQNANTFTQDQHKGLKADYIMANPPFNQKAWRGEKELTTDPRWGGYETPPMGNANYAWILHIASKLSSTGTAGFLLGNGSLSGDDAEQRIRTKLLDNDLIESIIVLPRNLFYTTDISVTLWILNTNKRARTDTRGIKYKDRRGKVLFMDLRQLGMEFEKKYVQLSDAVIARVANTYHAWQREGFGDYVDTPEFCFSATRQQIKDKEDTLVPSKYIEFNKADDLLDYDTSMQEVACSVSALLKEERTEHEHILRVFRELGYGEHL